MTSNELTQVWLSPWVLGLFGLCIGSFLNVVIHRLPRIMQRDWLAEGADYLSDPAELRQHGGLDAKGAASVSTAAQTLASSLEALPPLGIAKPRSRCPQCGHALRWHENLPLLGWLRLGGKCAACKKPISVRYPFVELLTGALFAAIAWRYGPTLHTLLYCGMAATLVALAGIDWDTTFLPESMNVPLLWAGLLAAWAGWTPVSLSSAMGGAIAGYLSLWSVYWLFKLVTGKEGMGYGDFKLLAALGAWLGWPALLPILVMASVLGAIVGVVMKLRASLREGGYVPFGPFLAGAGLLVLLVGPSQVQAWLGW